MLNSYFFALTLWCLAGYWLIALRERCGAHPIMHLSLGGCVALFAASRLLLAAMGGTMTPMLAMGFAVDAAAFAAVTVVEQRDPSPPRGCPLAGLYLFNPVIPLCTVMQNYVAATSAVLLFAAVYFAVAWLRRRVAMKQLLLPLYLATGGAYILAYCMVQVRADSELPITLLWVLGGLSLFFGGVFAFAALRKPCAPQTDTWQTGEAAAPSWLLQAQAAFTRSNVWDMLLLTLLGACIIFFRLGSLQAPQTGMTMGQNTDRKDMILSFSQPTTISKVYIFTGSLDSRSVSFFAYYDRTGTWTSVKADQELRSVFKWNSVELDSTFDNLGIVLNDTLAYINEVVIIDAQGQPVIPYNAGAYPLLFDEQACFPGLVTYYDGTMFDEVYHGRTAYEFLHLLPVYEWTHPPLGKALISLGIALFGMTPFGWRFVPALFGVLTIPLVYLFAWRLRRKSRTAVFACVLLMTSFMHTTLSRIATLDCIVGFFVLLMFYLMLCYLQDKDYDRRRARLDLLACGIATGLAVATKWTGCYAAAGIAVMFFAGTAPSYVRQWKQPGTPRDAGRLFALCVVSFIAVPAVIYVLSYIPYVRCGGGDNVLTLAVRNARHMLSYHVGITQSHPYQSEWYEWLVDRRPLLDSLSDGGDGTLVSVATFGNPVVMLGGLVAFACELRAWRLRGDKSGAVLCTAYLAMLLPWLLVHRTVFIYQYYPCVLLLAVMLGDVLAQGGRKRAGAVIGLSVILFACYYPVLTGAFAVSRRYVNLFLEWLPTWRFG